MIRSFTSKACRRDWGTRSIKVSRAAFTQGGGGVDYHSRRRRIPRSVLQDTTAGAAEEPAKGVAELTLTFILNLLREITSHQHNLNQGNWERTLGKSLNEATISLIGGGRVAKNVSKFLLSAGVKKIKVFDILDLSTDPDSRHESISICGFEECFYVVSACCCVRWSG